MDNDTWFQNEFKIGNFDINKMNKYIQMQLVVQFKKDGVSKMIVTSFRHCTPNDFLNNGISSKNLESEIG